MDRAARPARQGGHDRPHHAQARRGDRHLGDDHRDARRPHGGAHEHCQLDGTIDRARDGRPRRRACARRRVHRRLLDAGARRGAGAARGA